MLLLGCSDDARPASADAMPDAGAEPQEDMAQWSTGDCREATAAQPSIGSDALQLRCPRLQTCSTGAPQLGSVRVVLWNIMAALTAGVDRVIDQLAAIDADIILLQEVDVGVARSNRMDEPRLIAEALGHDYAFAPAIVWQGGWFGLATLSRLPFASVTQHPLDNQGASEARTALDTRLCVGPQPWRVIQHHADYVRGTAERTVHQLLEEIATQPDLPTVFAGDLNQEPSGAAPAACRAAGLTDAVEAFDPGPTNQNRRIDYVFVDSKLSDHLADAAVVDTSASDHRAVVVDLSL